MALIKVRPLKDHSEFRACEEIQREVWGMVSASAELLSVARNYGGAVLGAVAARQVVGFLFAFLARYRGELVHWSHLMAVKASFRDQGLGVRMKVLHRRLALRQRIRYICWTYDPLQSRNALLNVHRLGAEVEEYVPDFYGEFPTSLEKGLPSDRLVVIWRIASRGVERRLGRPLEARAFACGPCINETRLNRRHLLENCRISWNLSEPQLLVEIPAHTEVMRSEAAKLARRWRMETRRIFQHYLGAGYRVADFVRDGALPGHRCFYVLSRSEGAPS